MNHTVQGTGEGEQRTLIWKEEKYTVYTDCVLCAVELMSVVEDCGVNSVADTDGSNLWFTQ